MKRSERWQDEIRVKKTITQIIEYINNIEPGDYDNFEQQILLNIIKLKAKHVLNNINLNNLLGDKVKSDYTIDWDDYYRIEDELIEPNNNK